MHAGLNVKSSAAVAGLVPPGVVMVTSTVPTELAGDTAVMLESEFTVNDAARVGPKLTAVAPEKPPPTMMTVVPPVRRPPAGETNETAGLGMYVNLSVTTAAL
jgi:hypothetical protein